MLSLALSSSSFEDIFQGIHSGNVDLKNLENTTENLTGDEREDLLRNIVEEFAETSDSECNGTPIPSLATLEIVIAVIGLVFNGIAMFVIIILKDYKKSISHWYVLQLAIADSLFLAILPLQGHEHLNGIWVFSDWTCHLFKGVFMINYYAGIFFLTVMSFDRYVAIVHPVSARWRKLRSRKTAFIITVVVWILSILCSIPLFQSSAVIDCVCGYNFSYTEAEAKNIHVTSILDSLDKLDDFDASGIDYYGFSNNTFSEKEIMDHEHDVEETYYLESETHASGSCNVYPVKSFREWVIINFLLTFILPLVVMAICYSCILWRVLHPAVKPTSKAVGRRKSSERPSTNKRNFINSFRTRLSSSSSVRGSDKLTQKQKVTAIVVSLVVVFIVSWLPFQVVKLLQINRNLPETYGCVLLDISTALAYASSMLNPIFYTFLGSRFCHRLHSATTSVSSRKRSQMTRFTKTRSGRSGGASAGRNSGGAAAKNADVSSFHPNTCHSIVSKSSYPARDHYDTNHYLLTKQRSSQSGEEPQ